jgi:hypothetical protein
VNKFALAWSRHAWIPALAAAAALVASAASASAACPNEALRTGASANLPDCRGLELVSPAEKHGYDVAQQDLRAAAGGDGIAYLSHGAFVDGAEADPFFSTFLATRAQGWESREVSPPVDPLALPTAATFISWTPDLSHAVVQTPPNPPLTDDAEPNAPNIYLRDNDANSYSLLSPGVPPGPMTVLLAPPHFGAISTDLSHTIFGIRTALTPDAPSPAQDAEGNPLESSNLFDFSRGELHLASVRPGGEPFERGAVLGSGEAFGDTRRAISADGSRVFFTSIQTPAEPVPQIYARLDGAETIEASASQNPTPDPLGPLQPTYWGATTDGSSVFFTSNEKLTADAGTGANDEGADLYRFDLDSEELVDLTPASAPEELGAQVMGVVGTSDDGSYVYFVGAGKIAGKGEAGKPNLYVWHEGATSYIATLSPADADEWSNATVEKSPINGSRVAADGAQALFTTVAKQPGYENAGHSEIYRYDAQGGQWRCVSCRFGHTASGDASIAAPPRIEAGTLAEYATRALGPELVFFDTNEALAPDDRDETADVYEWREGDIALVSAGSDGVPAYFADASANGGDVYFTTRAALVPQDRDQLVDVYDARVGGGLAAPEASPSCEGQDCRQAPPPAPAGAQPASSAFTGPGDPAPKHRRRHHAKKRHKHHKRTRHGQRKRPRNG